MRTPVGGHTYQGYINHAVKHTYYSKWDYVLSTPRKQTFLCPFCMGHVMIILINRHKSFNSDKQRTQRTNPGDLLLSSDCDCCNVVLVDSIETVETSC